MKILKSYEHFELFLKFLKWEKKLNFWVFNRRWSLSVPNKYKTFIQSGRGTKNPGKSIVFMDRSIVKQLEKEKNSNFIGENFVVMFIYWGTIKRYNRDWTASFSIRFRNGTCKQIVHVPSGHMAVYGPVRHQKNMDRSVTKKILYGPKGPYTAIWPSVLWTICYIFELYGHWPTYDSSGTWFVQSNEKLTATE